MRLLSSLSAMAMALGLAACQPAVEQNPTMNTETKTDSTTAITETDPRLWLEEVEGEKALNWVNKQNERTLADLQNDPRYQTLFDEALAIVNATDKIAYGAHRGGFVYNFWQDAEHTHGLWRRTSLADYIGGNPTWDVLLDLDALSKAENENWVYKGVDCLSPHL
ncbi:MAG: hypothetical protein Q9M45_01255 [Robiginitomaculum sp.]|nr:hypothetical protein [Robiginitomaculum sp.]